MLAAVFIALLGGGQALLSAQGADEFRIDLAASPIYARVGFDPSTIDAAPSTGTGGWKALPPAGPGGRVARPTDFGFPDLPRRAPFSLARYKVMEFTYLIPFQVTPREAELLGGRSAIVPGIFFPYLGDNWELYLNGVLVRSEMHLAADGSIAQHRGFRYPRFPLDGRLFREGQNALALRIVADPSFPPAGIDQAGPFYIGSIESIESENSEAGAMVFIGLYVFIGIYYFFIFLMRTQDRHNLFYGLFSVDLGLYLFMRTYTITRLIPDGQAIFRVELFTLSLILPLVGAFLETLNDTKIKKITLWYGGLCSILALGEAVMPAAFSFDLLRVWQFTGLVMAFYYFGWDILARFLSDCRRRWTRERGTEGGRSLGRIYLKALWRTPIGNLAIGGVILFGTAVFDIIDALFLQWNLVLTKYGFFLFTMGTALILANRLGFLHDRLSGLNLELEERIRVLSETGLRLQASERRYRSLFEGSTDPIALLTDDLAIIEGNKAAAELFGLDRPDPPSSLLETIYSDRREGSIPAEYLRAAARSLRDRVGASELLLRIKAPIGEPKGYRLRLERIDALERKEILLRAAPEGKDALADFFVEGRERFDVESSLSATDAVCRRATAYLSKYLPEDESRFLGGCLREIVINAVEHGNLEIGFDEKTESMKAGRYFELLQERRLDPRYRSRKVVVEYSVSASRATFRVTDEGSGFDHGAFSRRDSEPTADMLEHGRGLFIAMNAFDKMLFNERGNQVTLVKYVEK
jgi:PAS domain-containing protein